MNIEDRLRQGASEAVRVAATFEKRPSTRTAGRTWLVTAAAVLAIIGLPLLVLTLVSNDSPVVGEAPPTTQPASVTTVTTITTVTMVPPMNAPAMERFYAMAGLEERSSPEGVLFSYTLGPEPIEVPTNVIEQALQAPTIDNTEWVTRAAAESDLADTRDTPLLVAGVNDASGTVVVAWVAPPEESGDDPQYCTGVLEATATSFTCGDPGLVSQVREPHDTPSKYTLPMIGATQYGEDGFILPVTLGSGHLPLETSYAILVGPNGDRWLQRPISATVLFAIDNDDPAGAYELFAYDRNGSELAIGLGSISRPDPSAMPDCEPPLRTELGVELKAALDLVGVIRPGDWSDGLAGPHAPRMPTAASLADEAGFECLFELTGYDSMNESTVVSIAWADNDYLAVIRTTFLPATLPAADETIDIPEVGAVDGNWLSETVFAGTIGGDDLVILLRDGEINWPPG